MRADLLPSSSVIGEDDMILAQYGVQCIQSRWHVYSLFASDDKKVKNLIIRYMSLHTGSWVSYTDLQKATDGFAIKAAAKRALYRMLQERKP